MITLTDLSSLSCGPDASMREALARINASPYLFQIVLDRTGRLLGTVTDGDLRRGMLRGATLDTPVRDCMRTGAITGVVGADAGNIKKLKAIAGLVAFLPILDRNKIVVEVLVEVGPQAGDLAVLLMAGGYGKRLGERTRKTPKPLLRVGDRPILAHILDRLDEAQVKDVYIAVHYLAEQIEKFVANRDSRIRLHLLHEKEPLGTAGALGALKAVHRGPILVMNGDVLTDTNIIALESFHRRHGYDGTIAVARYDVKIPFGVVRHTEDGLFVGVEEKPEISHFVAAGIYCLSPEFMALVPTNAPMNMPELLNLGRSIGLRIGLFPIHEYWRDVGRQHDLDAAERDHGNHT